MIEKHIEIHVPALARVEGEGALTLLIKDEQITDLKFSIYEPPRFFEKFLVGRSADEVIDVVARICGICPVAYQMSAVNALEAIASIKPDQQIVQLRQVMYAGEWIQSHGLHIFLLAAPDYFGCNSVVELSAKYPDHVRRGLFIQNVGNQLIKLFGGRSVHPVGVRIGGFYSMPDQNKIQEMLSLLQQGLDEAEAMLTWLCSFDLPDDQQSFVSVAMGGDEYPLYVGSSIISNAGHGFAIDQFENHIEEFQVPHSTAFHALLDGKPYLVGPLARMNLHHDKLPAELQQLMRRHGLSFPSANMFHSTIARAIEIIYAMLTAKKALQNLESHASLVATTLSAGTGFGCTEAPRGLLWQRYTTGNDGHIVNARIVPPTSQNQARIEEDLRLSLTRFGLDQSEDALRLHGEKVIRNYDPCISCATHFLDLKIQRT
ncbi:MAG: Ni/Fe hydrogenase subunit alpha [Gammaproteobacteria bacterium]|nr:Ni/Fe hydrogenase subunit alpha [Gammaproteobacteria bacterium]